MKLTRKQELVLIDLGLRWLVENLPPSADVDEEPVITREVVKKKKKYKPRKWSPEQRDKFRASMKKVWANRKKAQKAKLPTD